MRGTRLTDIVGKYENDGMDLKIGSILKKLLKQQGLSLKDLSKVSGVPTSTLGEWANDRNPRSAIQVKKVSEALGVSMHYLYFGEEDRDEPINKILKEDFFQGTFEISIKRVNLKGENK